MDSSINIGTNYEMFVFEYISSLLDNGKLFLNPKTSRVIHHPKYYSSDRKSDITFDISIETKYESSDKKPSLITLIECKCYSSAVSVDNVEEFISKVRQVTRLNVKAIFITNSIFQKSALAVGTANEIGMARLSPGGEIFWEYKRTAPVKHDIADENVRLFVIECMANQAIPQSNFAGIVNGLYTTDFIYFLYSQRIIDFYYSPDHYTDPTKINIKYIPRNELDDLGETYLSEISSVNSNINRIQNIIDGIKKLYGIKVTTDKHLGMIFDELILGKLNIDDNEIYISNTLSSNDPRWYFTLVHELSHFLLHKSIIEEMKLVMIDSRASLTGSDDDINDKALLRVEWQANALAAAIIAPKREFLYKTIELFERLKISRNFLYLDGQEVNRNLVSSVVTELSQYFQCSNHLIYIRLKEFELLKDESNKDMRKTLARFISNTF